MKKMKIGLVVLCFLIVSGVVTANEIYVQGENPLKDKIIALDAGHGGDKLGAQYPANCASDGDTSDCRVFEKDVNLAVVYALKEKLKASGANVVLTRECDETFSSNKDRVDLAVEKCQSQYGRKCDVLISVHHNGNIDKTHDGTLVIYNERQDIPLAVALHDALIAGLELKDEGYLHGGYGMTVLGRLVSALTEAYYITNEDEAGYYLSGASTTISNYDTKSACGYEVRFGERVNQEAEALYNGIFKYFSSLGEIDGPPQRNK